eukprot:gene7458-8280_t
MLEKQGSSLYLRRMTVKYCLIVIISLFMTTTASRILLLPFPWPSHYKALEKIGEELSKRGHEVNVIMSSTEKYRGKVSLNTTVYHVPHLPNNTFVSVAEERLKTGSGFGLSWLVQYVQLLDTYGRALLEDKKTAEYAIKADLVLSDTAFLVAPIFASHYNLPLVFLSPFGHLPGCMADVLGNIENPSYVPTFVGTSLFERIGLHQQMGFFHRSFNLLANALSKLLRELVTVQILRPLTERYSNKSLLKLWREKTSLVLIPMDYSVEYARHEAPNVKMIGPLTTTDSRKSPLPKEFRDIMEASVNGVVVVSFGITNAIHQKHVSIILNVLTKLKYTVIWRNDITKIKELILDESSAAKNAYNRANLSRNENASCLFSNQSIRGEFASPQCQINAERTEEQSVKIGNNVHVFDWLPQQELLQQNASVLLITHCGINSLYEAMYHATQVLCLPLFGEQFDNAGRVISRNLGKAITLHELSEQRLQRTIEDLIKDDTSKRDVIKVSRRLRRSKQSAAEKAAHWIEIVLDENGDMSYLTPIGADLSYIVYFSIDVIVFWSLVLIALYMLISKALSTIVRSNGFFDYVYGDSASV